MHSPTNQERGTFAQAIGKDKNLSPRQVRKRRQDGFLTSQPAPMPCDTRYEGYREVRFRPRWDKNHARWARIPYGEPQVRFG